MGEESVFEEIESLKRMIQIAKHIPLSRFVSIDREECLSKIERIRNLLPEEMKEAYLISKRKNAILKKANEERDRILETAKSRRDEIVQDSDILKEAKEEKQRILIEARRNAEKMEKEAEDYVFKLLTKTESILDKAQSVIESGKEDLKHEGPDNKDS